MDTNTTQWILNGELVTELEAILHDIVNFDEYAEEKLFFDIDTIAIDVTECCPFCGHEITDQYETKHYLGGAL